MRRALLLISLIGSSVFTPALIASFVSPLLIERAAREVVRLEVERRVGQKIDSLSNTRLVGLARRALEKVDADVQSVELAIREDVPRKVANVVADMLRADCECRKRLIEGAQRAETERLTSLGQLRERLVASIESTYATVRGALLREFRIFCASNALAFALLGAVALRRKRATLQLLVPAVVVVGAVTITAGLYLFGQNWLHTIVFGECVGMAYAAYLLAVAALLADVLLNRARFTSRVVNVVSSILGSTTHVVPC
jgi:hypothetical protein